MRGTGGQKEASPLGDEARAPRRTQPEGMTSSRGTNATLLCLVVLGAGLTACDDQETTTQPEATSSPTPAVCQSVDALRASVDDLQSAEIGENALTVLQEELSDVQNELDTISEEASGDYTTEVDGMRSAADSLGSSLEDASSSPSASTWATVAQDIGALGSAFGDLSEAVADTC